MATDSREALAVLKAELEFLEKGGYHPDELAVWRPQLMFQDSPTCLNSDPTQPRKSCSECILVQFVPKELRNKKIPCRHIPLDEKGETVDYFYNSGTQEELERVVARWLRNTIAGLEYERAEDLRRSEHPEVHVRARFVDSH